MKVHKTKVIFRKFHGGEIIAIFPEIPHDQHGLYCLSYLAIGQHGAASPDLVQDTTSKATPEEYKALADELTGLGYCLQVVTRRTAAMDKARFDAAKVQS